MSAATARAIAHALVCHCRWAAPRYVAIFNGRECAACGGMVFEDHHVGDELVRRTVAAVASVNARIDATAVSP